MAKRWVRRVSTVAWLAFSGMAGGAAAADSVLVGVYNCAGEQQVVQRCWLLCQVNYPNRPLRNGFMPQETETPTGLADRLRSCRYVADLDGRPVAANRAPTVAGTRPRGAVPTPRGSATAQPRAAAPTAPTSGRTLATAGYAGGTPATLATSGYAGGNPASAATSGYAGGTPSSLATSGYSGGTAPSLATSGF